MPRQHFRITLFDPPNGRPQISSGPVNHSVTDAPGEAKLRRSNKPKKRQQRRQSPDVVIEGRWCHLGQIENTTRIARRE
jgi:hypothetical protein